jgi:hypothetical protein
MQRRAGGRKVRAGMPDEASSAQGRTRRCAEASTAASSPPSPPSPCKAQNDKSPQGGSFYHHMPYHTTSCAILSQGPTFAASIDPHRCRQHAGSEKSSFQQDCVLRRPPRPPAGPSTRRRWRAWRAAAGPRALTSAAGRPGPAAPGAARPRPVGLDWRQAWHAARGTRRNAARCRECGARSRAAGLEVERKRGGCRACAHGRSSACSCNQRCYGVVPVRFSTCSPDPSRATPPA